jgi:hypothetical protein
MMNGNFRRLAATGLLFGASLFAHDAKLHKGKATEGEIVSVSPSTVVMKTATGNLNVSINKDTKYEMGSQAVDLNHFKKGDKISVIGTKLASGELVAKEVLMSAPPAKAAAKGKEEHKH